MLKVYYKPLMAYYICHELWIYPKSTMLLIGFMKSMVINCQNVFMSFMNNRIGIGIRCSGGQGGKVNVPWDLWVSSPKLGFSRRKESFALSLGELYSVLWSISWCEVWFCDSMLKVCPCF